MICGSSNNELGGVKGGNPAYMAALSNLDSDMPQYVADNTDDELSHAAFLNAICARRAPRAAYGVQQGRPVGIDLLAQLADIGLQHARVATEVVAPDVIE